MKESIELLTLSIICAASIIIVIFSKHGELKRLIDYIKAWWKRNIVDADPDEQ